MLASLSRRPCSNAATVSWTSDGLLVRLGRSAPHHDEAVATVLGLEGGDVVDDGHGLVPLARDVLHADAFETRHPALVEHGLHRDDRFELAGDRVQVGVVEHAGGARRFEGVRRDRVPAAEDDVVEAGERHELADHRVAILLFRPETDVRHLADRTDRRVQALAGGDDTGDEGRGNGAHAGREDTELAGGGSDLSCGHSSTISDHSFEHITVKQQLMYRAAGAATPRPVDPATRVPRRSAPRSRPGRSPPNGSG